MKITIKITKDILRKSMMCGTKEDKATQKSAVAANCAFALAIREIAPNAWISPVNIWWDYFDSHLSKDGAIRLDKLISSNLPVSAQLFIKQFDGLLHRPWLRLNFPEQEFEIDFPDEMIEKIGLSEFNEILSKSEVLSV